MFTTLSSEDLLWKGDSDWSDRELSAATAAVSSYQHDLTLWRGHDNQNSQGRIQSKEVVRGPQARVARTDDSDINLSVAREWRPRVERARIVIQPERSAAVVVDHLILSNL